MDGDSGVSQASAAPAEFDLHGQKLELYPLRWQDWGKIEQWMRSMIIGAAKSCMVDGGLSHTQQRLLMRTAHEEAARISLANCFFGEGRPTKEEEETDKPMAFLESFEGMLRVCYLSVVRGKPNLSLDEFDDMLGQDLIGLTEIYDNVFRISFPMPKGGTVSKNRKSAVRATKQRK